MVKVKKPYNRVLDAAIEKGLVELPATPDGLYLRRLKKDLDDAFIIRRKHEGVFECIRGEMVMEKTMESNRYATYKRGRKRWADLI